MIEIAESDVCHLFTRPIPSVCIRIDVKSNTYTCLICKALVVMIVWLDDIKFVTRIVFALYFCIVCNFDTYEARRWELTYVLYVLFHVMDLVCIPRNRETTARSKLIQLGGDLLIYWGFHMHVYSMQNVHLSAKNEFVVDVMKILSITSEAVRGCLTCISPIGASVMYLE
jgi:hypothetical protein